MLRNKYISLNSLLYLLPPGSSSADHALETERSGPQNSAAQY